MYLIKSNIIESSKIIHVVIKVNKLSMLLSIKSKSDSIFFGLYRSFRCIFPFSRGYHKNLDLAKHLGSILHPDCSNSLSIVHSSMCSKHTDNNNSNNPQGSKSYLWSCYNDLLVDTHLGFELMEVWIRCMTGNFPQRYYFFASIGFLALQLI